MWQQLAVVILLMLANLTFITCDGWMKLYEDLGLSQHKRKHRLGPMHYNTFLIVIVFVLYVSNKIPRSLHVIYKICNSFVHTG